MAFRIPVLVVGVMAVATACSHGRDSTAAKNPGSGPTSWPATAPAGVVADMDNGPRAGVAVLLVNEPREGLARARPTPAEPRTVATRAAQLRYSIPDLLKDIAADETSATRRTVWFKRFNGDLDTAARELRGLVTVRILPVGTLIELSVAAPDAHEASILADGLGAAFIKSGRENEQRIAEKEIDVLRQERKLVDIELNEEIRKQIHEKFGAIETDGGLAEISADERARMALELARERIRLDEMSTRSDWIKAAERDDKLPAFIEIKATETPRVRQLITELDAVRLTRAEAGGSATRPADDRLTRREEALGKLLAETMHEVGKRLLTAERDEMTVRMQTAAKDIAILEKATAGMARLSDELHQLQRRESDLVAKQNFLNDKITQIQQFDVQVPWTGLEFASHPAGLP